MGGIRSPFVGFHPCLSQPDQRSLGLRKHCICQQCVQNATTSIPTNGDLQSHFHTCKGVKNLHFVNFWTLGPIAIDSSRNFRSNGPSLIKFRGFSRDFGPKQGSTGSQHGFCVLMGIPNQVFAVFWAHIPNHIPQVVDPRYSATFNPQPRPLFQPMSGIAVGDRKSGD